MDGLNDGGAEQVDRGATGTAYSTHLGSFTYLQRKCAQERNMTTDMDIVIH